jgi:hypothetical protein
VRAEQLAICCEICWPPNHALKTTVRLPNSLIKPLHRSGAGAAADGENRLKGGNIPASCAPGEASRQEITSIKKEKGSAWKQMRFFFLEAMTLFEIKK